MNKAENKINVAIVGVGSFTKALLEGVAFYSRNPEEKLGLMNPLIGPYKVSDINFVCAFDVDERKVGKHLHEAIYSPPNVTKQIAESLQYPARVHRGPTLGSVHKALQGSFVIESGQKEADVAGILKDCKAHVVLNLVPSGSEQATLFYAQAALDAGCSFINCIPTTLATIPEWQERFKEKGLVLLGDDIKSQLGATMLNRILLEFLNMRGVRVVKSEQENRGGNADHYNLLYRADSKHKSKTEALKSFLGEDDAKPKVSFVYTGQPSGHKRVTINIEGEMFGRTAISIHSVIEDEISINGAGVAVDAIRAAKLLMDHGRQQDAWQVCPFLMKSPPKPVSDSKAHELFKNIIDV
jgi:myo-inositol-1-phosphate synthase